MLIITGMGRSGTSVLARFCHNMGYMVGGKWNEQVDAGMEEPIVVGINTRILNGEPEPDDVQRLADLNRLVVKDPRFTFPKVLETWLQHRKDLRFLVLLRNTRDAIHSRERHPDWFVKHETADALNSRIVDTFRLLSEADVPFATLAFPRYLDEYDRVHKLMTQWAGLSILKDRGARCWDTLVDHSKVHF